MNLVLCFISNMFAESILHVRGMIYTYHFNIAIENMVFFNFLIFWKIYLSKIMVISV